MMAPMKTMFNTGYNTWREQRVLSSSVKGHQPEINLEQGTEIPVFLGACDPHTVLTREKKICSISLLQPAFTRIEWAMAMSSQTDLIMPTPGLSDFWVGLWPRIPCFWPHLTDGVCQNARPELAKPFGHSVLDHPAVCTEANFYIQVKHSRAAFLWIWGYFSSEPSSSVVLGF